MIYRFLDFELDEAAKELRRDGEPVSIEPRVFELLAVLVRERAGFVSREALLERVWGGDSGSLPALHQALYMARRVLGDSSRNPRMLDSRRGRGVRFVADVTELPRRASMVTAGAAGAFPFVGRVDALAELQDTMDRARAGRGALVLISGEPGIGKTRLSEEFAARVSPQGVRAYFGRCRETEGAPSFWPWARLLRSYVEQLPTGAWTTLIEENPDLVHVAADLGGTPDPCPPRAVLDMGAERFRVFDAVSRHWAKIARDGPVLLVIDDVHQADESSWQLLRFMSQDIPDSQLVVIATYRISEIQRRPGRGQTIGELLRSSGARSIQLEGFSPRELAEFVNHALGRQLGIDVLDDLRRRTDGNPFFLSQVAPLLTQTAADGPLPRLPETVREAIARQLDALPDEARDLLAPASVVGRDFALPILAATVRQDALAVRETLGPALQARIVQRSQDGRPDELRFSHALVRDALYEAIPTAERPYAHLGIGRAMERIYRPNLGPHLAALAFHFDLASPVAGRAKAIDYGARAGKAACEQLAFDGAVPLLQRAVELAQDEGLDGREVCCLLILLGSAQNRAGARERARTTFQRAAEIAWSAGAHDLLAEVGLAMAPGFLSIEAGVVNPLMVRILESALEGLPRTATALRARCLARLAAALHWIPDSSRRRQQLVEDALAVSAEIDGDFETQAFVLLCCVIGTWNANNLEEREARIAEAIGFADRARALELALLARVFQIATYFERGALARVRTARAYLERLTDEHKLPQARWYPTLYSASLALSSGDLELAEQHAERLRAIAHRVGDANVRHSYSALVGSIRFHQGRMNEVIPPAMVLSAEFPGVSTWRAVLGMALARSGRRDEAVDLLEELLEAIPVAQRDLMWATTLAIAGETAADLNEQRGARILAELIEPLAGRIVTIGHGISTWGAMSRVAGRLACVLGNLAGAKKHFLDAIRLETRSGLVVWYPYSVSGYCEAVRRDGRSVECARSIPIAKRAARVAGRVGAIPAQARLLALAGELEKMS